MDFKKLTQRAKKVVDDRGGTEALKKDLDELKDIAKGKGSITDKAKEAAAALKHPGQAEAPHRPDPETGAPPRPAEPGVHPAPTPDVEAPDAGLQPDPEQPTR
jgi:hypothetical protein